MRFTAQGLALLKRLEGCRLSAYQDQAGVWTIGYGHTGSDAHRGATWTQAQADEVLARDVERFSQNVALATKNAKLTDEQFSALVIFCFNVGVIAFLGSTALRDVKQGRLEDVPRELGKWKYIHNQSGVAVVNAGLANRRAAEIALWNTKKENV